MAAPDATLDALERDLFARALLRGSFTLRSGRTSDRYFDKYRATTDPVLLGRIAERMAQLVADLDEPVDAIVAPELGAVPLAAALSLQTGLPYAIVRSAGKQYGTARQIEGVLAAGTRAVLVEDVVTSGGAAVEAAAVAREAGAAIHTCICLLDRGEGGRETLAGEGIELASVVAPGAMDAAWAAGIGAETA